MAWTMVELMAEQRVHELAASEVASWAVRWTDLMGGRSVGAKAERRVGGTVDGLVAETEKKWADSWIAEMV